MQARPDGETRLRSATRRLSRPGLIESATIILILILYSGAIFVVLITGATTENSLLSDGEREGLRTLFFPAYLATLALVLPRWAAFGRAMVANPLFVFLLLMAGYTLASSAASWDGKLDLLLSLILMAVVVYLLLVFLKHVVLFIRRHYYRRKRRQLEKSAYLPSS